MSTDLPTAPGVYIEKGPDWDSQGWTSVPNGVLRDPNLPWEAKGAFGWMASHRELLYRVSADDLAGAGPNGRNHARDMIRALEQHGWLTRHKHRNAETGEYDLHVWRLHPTPVPVSERTFVPSTAKKRTFPAEKAQVTPATAGAGAGDDHAEQTPTSDPAPARPGAGQPGAGQPVTGPSGAIEKTKKKIPPTPASGGDRSAPTTTTTDLDRCTAHGRTSCRPCGTSPRAQERAATRAGVLETHERRVAVTLEGRQDRAARRAAAAEAGLSQREAIRRQLQERRSAG